MENTQTDLSQHQTPMTTTANNEIKAGVTQTKVEVSNDLKENNGEQKSYYFQTQSKRLKSYYYDHHQQLIGRKILFNNSSGIVRYFGHLQHTGKPVSSKDQLWIGIEWDDFGRGKHNGTVSGFKYFQCPENQGSMIKYDKIEFGYRLETALFKRYFKAQQLHHAKNIYENLKQIKEELKNETQKVQNQKIEETMTKKIHKIEYDAQAFLYTVKKSKKIAIEFVGFDQIWSKINNLNKLQSISLAQCRICDLGPVGHLSNLLKSLRVLSLEDNLLSSWNQVYQLGYQLPELVELSVSFNNIDPPSQNFQNLKHIEVVGRDEVIDLQNREIFKNLRCLILIRTGLTWKTFFKIVSAFRRVYDFILCKNDLSDTQNIDLDKLRLLQQTRFLNLEQTEQKCFDKLKPFSLLPNLEKLILNKNPLKQLGRNTTGFKSLRYLSVQQCQFVKPVVLSQISLIKSIQSLNVKHNPMGQKFGNSYVRMRAVAELKKLNIINGAQLKKYERKDCQIFYLRESFREYFAVKKVPDYDYDFDDFLKYCEEHHPNIPTLIQIYGNPFEVEKKKQIQALIKEQVKVTENKKGTGMVEVLIEYKDSGSLDKKKVPLSWTLSSLKNFFSKTLKFPVGLLKLTSFSDQTSTGEEMTEDHKTLSFYNLKSGSKILVERRLG